MPLERLIGISDLATYSNLYPSAWQQMAVGGSLFHRNVAE